MKKKNITKSLIMAAIFLIVPMIISQTILAGDSGCQSGTLAHKYNAFGRQTTAEQQKRQEQFQAAQIRNGENQPPTAGGLTAGDSEMRSQISYFASVFFLLGGIWLLVSLFKERWLKRYAPKSVRLAKVWNFALKPSFALSAFAFLFAAVIAGSILTSPRITSAQEKSERSDQLNQNENSTNAVAAVNQPVFKSARQIGGDGLTQIGAPIYDGYGNYYVRGAFSGTLNLGETVLTATQGLDLFIAKFDAQENLLWARQGSGITNAPNDDLAVEGATAMAFNGDDLYVAGSFVKTLTLQGGANPGVTLTDNGMPGYNYETFVAKYDQNGNLIWARGGNSGSPKNADNLEIGQNTINRIVFNNNGSLYLAGIISGSNFLGAPISNFICNTLQPCQINGKSDVLLAALDPQNGQPFRLKVFGGAGDDNALDLAIDRTSNEANQTFYMVGNTDSPQINFRTTTILQTYPNPDNSISTFILKFTADDVGEISDGVWLKFVDNDNLVGIKQIVTDPTTGGAFVTGYYKGTLTSQNNSITNTRTGTDEAALAGFAAGVSPNDGSFVGLVGLGGAGNSLVIRPGQNIFVVGSLWDTGTFTSTGGPFGTPITKTLDAYGGNDLFVAEISRSNFQLSSLKAIAGTGYQGLVAVGNPSTADGGTKNNYSPLGITLDESGHVVISGDFAGTLSLDCLTLKTSGASRHAYIAKFLSYNEPTSCRVWTNDNPQNRNWDVSDNWNGGVLPSSGDSVYVPYHGNAVYNPIYNPANNISLSGLSISDNQTLFLQQNLSVNDQLDLLGGRIDTGANQVNLGAFSGTYSNNGGRVIGKLEKLFFGTGDSFTFPVGTANGYSPVTISNYNAGKGATFAVTAHQGTYPNTANNLPTNRAARWWNLTNGGLVRTDLTFQYLPGDITTGNESEYRAYRIPTGGGTAISIPSTVNTATKTVSVPNVSQFSDWTLAQPNVPTAATANVGGRVLAANGQGIANARITITDSTGNSQTISTNSFGYYMFSQVLAGDTYVLTIRHKRYNFSQPTQIVSVSNDRDDINFIETP